MLRSKGLTDKLLVLGIDGMDPRFSKAMIDEGKMPNLKRLVDLGAARNDLTMLGAMPTVTPPMWATLATGCYPMTHGIQDYNLQVKNELDLTQEAFMSKFCKAEQIWNCTAEAGKKTLVWHWPGGSWPPSSDSPNLMVVDGTSPGGLGHNALQRDAEVIIIATEKTKEGGYVPSGSASSHIDCDISELSYHENVFKCDPKDPRIDEYYEEYCEGLEFQGYRPSKFLSVRNFIFYHETNMVALADWYSNVSMSPIADANGWANASADAKEFTIYYDYGRIQRPALILKNDGVYNQVAVYASKETEIPLFVLDNDVYTPNCPDTVGNSNVVRNMRLLEIAEDGSYIRMWASNAVDSNNSDIWYPRWICEKIQNQFGPPPATSMVAGQDEDLILKCSQAQWKHAADWQSASMQYMMDNEGVEVIFSHFHGPDMSAHSYIRYMKERETSQYSEDVVRKWHENTYKWTDEYIGSFLPYIDKGWTIILVSDHSLICPEKIPNQTSDNSGLNVGVMKELGYTVLKRDENGNEIEEIEWSKTRAIQTRSNSVYLNLKGRNPYGIVDPADKYEVEEQIITDLYGYRDKYTGKRVISVALHNKDAVLFGLGGSDAADIIIMVHEDYNLDHCDSLSTALGHNDTAVGPIFVAAGPGVKENYEIKGYVREVDIAPTAAVLLGVNIPADCEGAPAYSIFEERL